jgi:hypothetical protein
MSAQAAHKTQHMPQLPSNDSLVLPVDINAAVWYDSQAFILPTFPHAANLAAPPA